ncbi:MAG: hydroxyphenylacetyl-CoA thioesterase PaaI [Beijerinckiaceae bacterium]
MSDDAEAMARACAEAMWADDEASRALGMQLKHAAPGKAMISMPVTADKVNGQKICHGGFIFLLADSTFAFACNTYNERVVAQHCAVSFLRPAKLGDLLIAEAREVYRGGRSGIYDVTVERDDGTMIAAFRGHSRVIEGTWLKEKKR